MLGPVIQNLVKSAVKSAANFEVAIDPLIEQLSQSCPSKSELDKILAKKNQLSQALTQVQTSLSTITDTGATLDGILTGLNTAVTVIKLLPIPAAVPPGVGIPLNVINGFSSGLDSLGVLIKEGKGTVSQIAPSINIITGNIAKIQDKLSQLDGLLAECLAEQAEEDLLWSPIKDYITDDQAYLVDGEGNKTYYKAIEANLNKRPDQNPTIWGESNENDAKEKYFSKLGINLSSPSTTGDGTNTEQGESLEDRLSANSLNPYVYKGYTIVLDENKENKFSFPERRAIGTNEDGEKIIGPWSYSSSTQVLLDGVKFLIDKQSSIELREADEAALIEEARLKRERQLEQARLAREAKLKQELDLAFNQGVQSAKNNVRLTNNPYIRGRQDLKAKWDEGFNSLQFISTPSSNSTTTTTTNTNITNTPDYNPIGSPGADREVKFRSSKLYQYNASTKKWKEFYPNYAPFTSKGTSDGITQDRTYYETIDGISTRIVDTYKWSQKYYRWEFQSKKTY